MNDIIDKEMFSVLFTVLLSVFVVLVTLFTVINGLAYMVNNVPVKVLAGEKIIYQGRSACVDIRTGGAATQVTIKGGLFCMLPKEYYVGNDVKVETMELK